MRYPTGIEGREGLHFQVGHFLQIPGAREEKGATACPARKAHHGLGA